MLNMFSRALCRRDWRRVAAVIVLSALPVTSALTAPAAKSRDTAPSLATAPAKPDAGAEGETRDPLLAARFAGVEGRFEDCAKLADEARRRRDAYWRAHHVYATCETFAADEARDRIGPEAYIERIEKAVDAFRFLLETPGVVVASDRRRSISFMIDELVKRISRERDRARQADAEDKP